MPYFHDFIDYMTFYTLCLVFTHDFCFMRLYELYYYLSVDDRVIFIFSWIHSCFIPYLKDFVLVYKIIIKLVALFFILVEFFKLYQILFLKTPNFKGRLDGRPCLLCLNEYLWSCA